MKLSQLKGLMFEFPTAGFASSRHMTSSTETCHIPSFRVIQACNYWLPS